ncbi:TPA: 4-alpha-glucanotransferase [Candidatus Avigastranaerophilus faecigallinarum]|nr:4-alpha-glucanotransferase [Candidatus Avigastranaerophilus faecigallinarum]
MTYCDEKNISPFSSVEAKNIIKEALKVLGKKHFAFIAHANSFPAESGKNTGFGSSNSNAAKKLMDFLSGVFTDVQLGPSGKTKSIDASPYTGTIFSNNPLFIDLEQLTTDEWFNILSVETYNKITENNPNKDTNKTAYSYIFNEQEKALKEAFENFKKLDNAELKSKFEDYKEKNKFWLEKDSLYEALIIENGNDYWPMWKSETDKCLFNPQNDEQKVQYEKRIKELEEKYADVIEYYSFCQFVISVQNEKTREYAQSRGLKMIADRQVAFSDRDNWAYQAYFLKGWCLGCPPDYFSEDGQAWGFPVMDPEKLFNHDGSLGEGGLLMKELYKKMFTENPGGVRIDHMVGLIDPWVYVAGRKPKIEEGAGRLYSSPEHPVLSRYAIATMDDLNNEVEADKEERIIKLTHEQVRKYGRLVEKIVIGAAEEVGLDKDSIVCEDLGTLTMPVVSVMKEYDLQGMKLIQFVVPEKPMHPYRCKNINERCWAMVGTHDNEPIAMWANATVHTEAGYLNGKNLAEDLYPDANDAEREQIAVRCSNDAEFLTQNKLIELFACKAENIQIFFTDFLGLYDVYNRPGTSGDSNWSLRIPDNYEEVYCNNLKSGKALNLPLILKLAIYARGNEFANANQEIINKLESIM